MRLGTRRSELKRTKTFLRSRHFCFLRSFSLFLASKEERGNAGYHAAPPQGSSAAFLIRFMTSTGINKSRCQSLWLRNYLGTAPAINLIKGFSLLKNEQTAGPDARSYQFRRTSLRAMSSLLGRLLKGKGRKQRGGWGCT